MCYIISLMTVKAKMLKNMIVYSGTYGISLQYPGIIALDTINYLIFYFIKHGGRR